MEKKVATSTKDAKAKEAKAVKAGSSQKERIMYEVKIFHEWCKSCGICSALCPKKVIGAGKTGEPFVGDADNCIGCRVCEIHCPDFAITVKDRSKARGNKNGQRK